MENTLSLSNTAKVKPKDGTGKSVGGTVAHNYRYDDWNRLTGAAGTFGTGGSSASYTPAMAYDEVYNIVRKKLDLELHIPLFSTTM
ncbi:MAG: hypothetical protein J5875_12690 [Paludibacteraceae bacterium]|nr:hypothetical protein [Paludibacteraceae bacterium]